MLPTTASRGPAGMAHGPGAGASRITSSKLTLRSLLTWIAVKLSSEDEAARHGWERSSPLDGRIPSLSSINQSATASLNARISELRRSSPDGNITLASFLPSATTTAFLFSCLLWYSSSALSSNTSKALLSSPKHVTPRPPPPFPYPVSLTLIQFGFVHVCCLGLCSPSLMRGLGAVLPANLMRSRGLDRPITKLRKPSQEKMWEMARLSIFNVVGHALSSLAISRVPVSTVHTIKALTPLFTVLAFRWGFSVHYSAQTYLSLIPLTLGVMMACTGMAFNADDIVGLTAALGSTCVFVANNILSKKLMSKGGSSSGAPGAPASEKMDKINILYYSSGMSVVLMLPMTLWSDGWRLLSRMFALSGNAYEMQQAAASSVGYVGTASGLSIALGIVYLLTLNGVVHFAQNILAFNVLGLVSPVTYSIASLFKRVFVIVVAIIWFGQSVSFMQWCGIFLTFAGLYMYNQTKSKTSVAAGEAQMRREERRSSLALPTTRSQGLEDLRMNERSISTPAHYAYAGMPQSAGLPPKSSMGGVAGPGGGFRDMSSVGINVRGSGSGSGVEAGSGNPATLRGGSSPASTTAGSAAAAAARSGSTPSFLRDPRSSLPSPPPSGRSSPDEAKEAAAAAAAAAAGAGAKRD